jgi:hypothetical protein
MKRKNDGFLLCLLVLCFFYRSSVCAGQFVKTNPDEITEELKGGDAAKMGEAVQKIHVAIDEDAYRAVIKLQQQWMTFLVHADRLDDVAELSREAIIATPYLNWGLDYFEPLRIRALVKSKRFDDALAEAKSYFNVASMKQADSAIQLITDCLSAMHPDKPEIVQQFMKEQADGANEAGGHSSILDGIKIDPKPFEDRMAKLTMGEDRHNVGRNNLLLLADRCKEAREGFEESLAKAKGEKNKTYATADVAKAIKGEDGTIGRATAWLKAHQPG